MLMPVAPWLHPPDFLGAMEAGSAAGTRQRAQAASESEAADRLRLAYDSLASHEKMQNETAQAKMAANEAAMDLRRSQMEGLQDYREKQAGFRQQALDTAADSLQERTRHDVSMEEARAAVKSGQATIVEHPEFPGVKFLRNPSGAESRISPSERAPSVRLDAAGKPQGYTGQLSNPVIQSLMGTNAPTALNPQTASVAAPDTPASPGFLERASNFLTGGGTPEIQPIIPGAIAPSAADSLSAQTAPASKRVRVVGPGGKKGTVPEGTDLPEGWKLAE